MKLTWKQFGLGKTIAELELPEGVIIAIVKRREKIIIPRGDIVLQEKDSIVIGAAPFEEYEKINLTIAFDKEGGSFAGFDALIPLVALENT